LLSIIFLDWKLNIGLKMKIVNYWSKIIFIVLLLFSLVAKSIAADSIIAEHESSDVEIKPTTHYGMGYEQRMSQTQTNAGIDTSYQSPNLRSTQSMSNFSKPNRPTRPTKPNRPSRH